MGYLIKDNNGYFPWYLGLSLKEDGKEVCWDYVAFRNADHWHGDKNQAVSQIKKLEELNSIAGFEGLTWELVCANPDDFPCDRDPKSLILEQDIPKGSLTKTRKAVKEICKKYKTIFKEIEMKWREKTNGGGAPIN